MEFTMLIRFIRKITASETDDTICIKHVSTNRYSMVYTYGSSPKTVRSTILTRGAVKNYLKSVFALLQIDTDPFSFVQLDFSMMPSILVGIQDLQSSAVSTAITFHMAIEDDEEEEAAAEDEYADMPGLIPISSSYAADRYFSSCGRHEIYEEED
jgi:hypothetical protein